MENKKKLKNNLYIAVGIAVVICFLYFSLLSMVNKKQRGDLLTATTRLKSLEMAQANFSTFEKLLRDTKDEREKLDTFMVEKKTIASFIENLEMLAKHAGVEITKTLSIEKNTQRSKESLLKFNLRAKGSFKDIYYFSLLLESMPYKIRIRKMAMGTSGATVSSVTSGTLAISKTKKETNTELWNGEYNFELLSYLNE